MLNYQQCEYSSSGDADQQQGGRSVPHPHSPLLPPPSLSLHTKVHQVIQGGQCRNCSCRKGIYKKETIKLIMPIMSLKSVYLKGQARGSKDGVGRSKPLHFTSP